MRRTMMTMLAVALTASLGLVGCSDNGGGNGGDGTGGDDGGSTTADASGGDTSDATGGDTSDATGGDTTADATGGDTSDATGGDTSDATGGDTSDGGGDGGMTQDFNWQWGPDCPSDQPTDYAGVVEVGAGGAAYATVKSNNTGDAEGNVTIAPEEWVLFQWQSGPHTVSGDKWDDGSGNNCNEDDLAWWDSGEHSSGIGCLQINKTEETKYWYQCTVGQHCENGMAAWIQVSP